MTNNDEYINRSITSLG